MLLDPEQQTQLLIVRYLAFTALAALLFAYHADAITLVAWLVGVLLPSQHLLDTLFLPPDTERPLSA